MKNNICKDAPILFPYFLKYVGDKYGLRRSRFGHMSGRSKYVPKSIAICPGVDIGHLEQLKPPKPPIIILKDQEQSKDHPNSLPYFGPY